MDEKFITRAFSTMGEQAVSVRIIRSKVPGWEWKLWVALGCCCCYTRDSNLTFDSAPPSSSALGYCFVEMADEATAERCLRKINGKSLPGASPVWRIVGEYVAIISGRLTSFIFLLQPTRFKLNRATFGKQETGWDVTKKQAINRNLECDHIMCRHNRSRFIFCSQMYSLFVGDLTPEVDDGMLYEFFYNRFPSCRGGKVVLDSMGNSK